VVNANDGSAIRQIIEARAQAVRAGDVDAMVVNVADDVVMFDVIDPLRREGRASRIAVDGDVAFGHALSRVTGKLKTGRTSICGSARLAASVESVAWPVADHA
jgi:ketosteroid isomerase-like protein